MRGRHLSLIALLALIFFSIWFIQANRERISAGMAAGGKRPANTAPQEQPLAANQPAPAHPPPPQEEGLKLPPPGIEPVPPASNFPPEGPLGGADADEHPIAHLINEATQEFQEMRGRQSQNLEQAVEEYKRRYAMPPPPHFDVWFNLAQEKGVRITDDYDTIYHSLLPFWGVKPATIRERAREVIAFKRMVVGVMIRDKKITKAQRADETKHWRAEALKKMIEPYVEYLPDMDLAINDNDEPRVVIPSDDLTVLQQRGTQEVLQLAAKQGTQHEWSPRPEGLNPGDRWYDGRTHRFNKYDRERIWEVCRMSCPPDSPSRDLDDAAPDDTAPYRYTDLGFVSNKTAHSDICLTPSLQRTFGVFERPNSMSMSHVLLPIFSQSKISSFQDILYPSPWYWSYIIPYDEAQDKEWDSKQNTLYWRGTTTGGYSRAGGWRRHHRQIFVGRINGLTRANILEKREGPEPGQKHWAVVKAPRTDYRDLFDVKFTEIKHCDKEDCEAQEKYFDIAKREPQTRAWSFKHLVDIDGHGFSGRFYSFLYSNSLPYKSAMYREWHEEWIKPWVHYVPLSHKGDEHVELMRYFGRDSDGQLKARQLAQQGKEMARTMLRKEDMELWLFRLLLEYARVIDDNRASLGFTLP